MLKKVHEIYYFFGILSTIPLHPPIAIGGVGGGGVGGGGMNS